MCPRLYLPAKCRGENGKRKRGSKKGRDVLGNKRGDRAGISQLGVTESPGLPGILNRGQISGSRCCLLPLICLPEMKGTAEASPRLWIFELFSCLRRRLWRQPATPGWTFTFCLVWVYYYLTIVSSRPHCSTWQPLPSSEVHYNGPHLCPPGTYRNISRSPRGVRYI